MPQTIFLMSRREDPFARVPKEMLDDERLSWRAKGLLSYLIGKPPDWKVRRTDLVKRSKEGETVVRAALKELREAGYAKLKKEKDTKGRLVEWVWNISDFPIFSPDVDSPHVASAPITKKELTKIESEESKETSPSDDGVISSEWKPSERRKEDQLGRIRVRRGYPSQDEFNDFLEANNLENVLSYRPDLYRELCVNKWRQWRESAGRWQPIVDWRAYVQALNDTIAANFQ